MRLVSVGIDPDHLYFCIDLYVGHWSYWIDLPTTFPLSYSISNDSYTNIS